MPEAKLISIASLLRNAKSRIEERFVRDGNFPSPFNTLNAEGGYMNAPCSALGFDFNPQ